MSTIPDRVPAPAPSFARPVDPTLIHRRNPAEAFLTDLVRAGPHVFTAAAVLPAGHPHYSGHTGPNRTRDPMLLLECARQAVTYTAHTAYDLELDVRLLVHSWKAEFAVPAGPLPGPGPEELVITLETGDRRLVSGRLRGLTYAMELWCAGAWAGRVRMEIGCLSVGAYELVRSRKHGDRLPSSDELPPLEGVAVTPALAGRLRATDVLLLDVAAGENAVTGLLRVPTENPSLFDHTQDHVPGMALAEAARQIAVLAAAHWGGARPDRSRMAELTMTFNAYAELAEPIRLTAMPDDDGPAGVAGETGRAVRVTFEQEDAEIADARIGLAA